MTKNVLITGGSRGIGLGTALALAEAGYNLAINGVRDVDQVTDTLQEVKKFGAQVVYCQGNIALAADRETILSTAQTALGPLHVLVNNAGVAPKNRVDLLETTEESYNRVLDINLKGTFFLTQRFAKQLIESKKADKNFGGCIVNISSVSATMASVMRGEYCISKAGLSMVTKLFATRLGAHDIPVYELRPGIIKTDMTAGTLEKYEKLIAEGLTLEARIGLAEDIGKTVTALVQGKIPYATGQVITVDGGLSLPRF